MDRIIYFNGSFISEKDAHIPVTTHALHYGTGCFEGIRAYYNQKHSALYIFRLEDHYKRLFNSCQILHIKLSKSISELCDITKELVKKNYSETDIYIRPLAYKADVAVGNFNLETLKDGFLIYTTPLGRYLDTKKGVRAMVSSWVRVSDKSIPPRGKITGSYANTALAKTESLEKGYDEAIFLDGKGHVVEGSAENIFLVQGNTLITPPITDDILQGITRNTVIQLAKDELKMEVLERSIEKEELYQSDGVILVGTGAEISPVTEIDDKKIGNESSQEISEKIKKMYFDIVHGENPTYSKWLTKVTQ